MKSWISESKSAQKKKERTERINVTFGGSGAADMDAVLALERYELLYEVGLVEEAARDASAADGKKRRQAENTQAEGMGLSAHVRPSAHTCDRIGRLRGKLAYRPVVFDLMPGEFTLLQLQRVVEALSGAKLHKQNFRRLVTSGDLVEPVGRTSTVGRGRPAELFRFRREVLGEKLTIGVARPVMRSRDG